MYHVGTHLPVETLPAGAYFVAGPPMTGQEQLVFDLLADGAARGERPALVSTDHSADAVAGRLTSWPSLADALHIVDCTGDGSDSPRVATVSSPGDLTGIGIHVSGFLDEQSQRVGLVSLSTLLVYTDFKRVFRFLHVFANRLRNADALGLFVFNPSAHDARVTDSLLELGEGIIEFREVEDAVECRVRTDEVRTDWTPQ